MDPKNTNDASSLMSSRHKDYIEMLTRTASESQASSSRVATENSGSVSAIAIREEVPFASSSNANRQDQHPSPLPPHRHGLERSAAVQHVETGLILEAVAVPILSNEETHSNNTVPVVFPVQERGPPGPDQDTDEGVFQPSRPRKKVGNNRRINKQRWLIAAAMLIITTTIVTVSVVMVQKNKNNKNGDGTVSGSEDPKLPYNPSSSSQPSTLSPPSPDPTVPPTAYPYWTQLGKSLEGQAPGDDFGFSIALSPDGQTLAVGAPYHDLHNVLDAGHVRAYQYDSSANVWKPKGQELFGQDADERFGRSVSFSSGSFLAVGSPRRNSKRGAVRVFQYNEADDYWVKLGRDLDGEDDGDWSGHSVALASPQGTNVSHVVAIGAPRNDGRGYDAAGHVRVYKFGDDNQWIQMGQDLDGESASDRFGWSVAISQDGNRLAVGARWNSHTGTRTGHARVFEYNANTTAWEQLGLDLDGQGANDEFGASIALSADGFTVAVGAWRRDDGPNRVDAGYVLVFEFDRSADKWRKKGQPLIGDAANDFLGWDVSLSHNGDIIATSSFGRGYNIVRLFEFDRVSREWARLGPDLVGEETNDWFGYSIDLSSQGTTVAASAPKYDNTGKDTGHVRVFKPEEDAW